MNNLRKTVLTLSMQNTGHGTLPRHKRMALSLKKKGFNVIWISPSGHNHRALKKIDLLFNFIPDFLFLGIYAKLFITCLINYKKIRNVDYVLAIREYDAIALFYNPFFFNSKKILFSRGDVISILKINLPNQKIFRKLKDRIIISIYPFIQRMMLYQLDLIIFQATFLKKLFKSRNRSSIFKSKILANDCIITKKKIIEKKQNNQITIGFAAPMFWNCKGLDVVVKFYRELSKRNIKFKLLIAGDGPHSNLLIKELNNISKNNFTWLGWVKNIDLFFNKLDLLIIPSKYDSCPNLLLEAISKNKILFASDIPAHKEILKIDEFLFSINSMKKLIDKILKFQKSNIYKKKLKNKIYLIKKKNIFDWDKKFVELIHKC